MTPPDPKLHSMPEPAAAAPTAEPVSARPSRKRRVLGALAALVALALLAAGLHAFVTRGDVGTDDAFVEADVVAVAPRVGGTIAEVLVQENAPVRRGQAIVRIDDADHQARARQAQAELETARAQAAAADAQVRAARATLSRADAEDEKARLDFRRAEELKAGEAIAADRYDATRLSSETARAGAGANRAQYAAALANADLARARVQVERGDARARAAAGLVHGDCGRRRRGRRAPRRARAGKLSSPGQVLGQVVPSRTYVVANFKETQTGAIRPGQRVEVEIDAYPGRKLAGRVVELSGGTGARFALLRPTTPRGTS